jgi:hypothetical protein
MALVLTILVVLAFAFRLAATFPVQYADRLAWGFAFAAALVWAFQRHG